jgi:hypothetical protein
MDVRKLLKVYNYVNDERRPKVNLKFAAALAGFLLSGAMLVGFVALQQGASPSDGAGPQAAARTDYVGLSTEEIARGQLDPALVQQRWAQWQAEHPGANVEKREEVRVQPGNVLVGYRVTYRE